MWYCEAGEDVELTLKGEDCDVDAGMEHESQWAQALFSGLGGQRGVELKFGVSGHKTRNATQATSHRHVNVNTLHAEHEIQLLSYYYLASPAHYHLPPIYSRQGRKQANVFSLARVILRLSHTLHALSLKVRLRLFLCYLVTFCQRLVKCQLQGVHLSLHYRELHYNALRLHRLLFNQTRCSPF